MNSNRYAEWPCIIKKNVAYYYSLKEILDVTSYRNSSAAPEMAAVQNIRRVGKEIRMEKLELQKMANEVRKGIITGVHSAKAGHPGGSLSAADIFTYLYFEEMNIDPANPEK